MPGDSILFKRNESWREQLIVPSSGQAGNPITFGAYGNGKKPLFLGSIAKNNASDWTNLGANKWATTGGSFPKLNWRSVGFLLMGQEVQGNVGTWVANEVDLDQEGEFWWEAANERVILYSPQGNPASVFGVVEIAHRHSCFLLEFKDYLVIEDLAFKYSNISAIMPDACNHITIQNIDASYLGGGHGSTTRAGDAIPPHGSSSYILIRDCNISQVFDGGIAPQLYPLETVVMNDIIVENCTIDKCGTGIIIAAHAAVAAEIYNIYIRNNIITNSGYGWSGIDNNEHGKGISIKEIHGPVKPDVHDIYIENNLIDTYAFRGINAYEGNFNITGNVVKNGTAEYIEGTIAFPGAIALLGGDYVSSNSPGEATGIVAYNLIYDNVCHGIFIINNTPYPAEPLEIYNNVLYNNGDTSYASIRSSSSSGTIIKNNIIYSENQDFIETGPFGDGTTTLNNNLFYDPSGGVWNWDGITYSDIQSYQAASGQDSSSVFSGPQFIDPNNYDFHLLQSSPAIDAGTDVGLSQDFDSIPVPQGIAADIGAFEYDVTIGIDDVYANDIFYPNPTSGQLYLNALGLKNHTVQICNMSGSVIYSNFKYDGNNKSIEFNAPQGIYILEITSISGKNWRCKIIKI
ncbi:MAG TPA: T9SS type A sorting domain-containing protein [Flavobacteriales bacterium]|nr:T9SS type A sorting domain-containing protein [Flavobacteriales bacterium]